MKYDRELLEQIVQLVLEKMQEGAGSISDTAKGKKILALMSGGIIGAEDAGSELAALQKKGFQISALFTPSGEKVLGSEWLQAKAPGIHVIPSQSPESALTLLKNVDLVLLPVMTFNTAAKIACGIADNLATSIIMQALLQGKKIIAAGNACDIDSAYLPKPLTRNVVYRNRLRDNITLIKQFGIQLVSADALSEATESYFDEPWGKVADRVDTNVKASASTTFFPEKVLSAADVSKFGHSEIKVKSGTIITMAARELAKERNIPIVVER